MHSFTYSRARSSMMIALVVLVSLIAGTRTTAYATCCPNYTVTVNSSVPSACFPMTVDVAWSSGTGTCTFLAPGTMTVAPATCWVPPLLSVTINGVSVSSPSGCVTVPVLLPCGSRILCVGTAASGCPLFTIN